MKNTNLKLDTKLIFWIGILVIGLGALIAGIILIVKTGNNLMWLIISFGIILTLAGLLFTVYLSIIKHKQKTVRSKGI